MAIAYHSCGCTHLRDTERKTCGWKMADGRTHGTVTVILATAGGLLCTAFTGNLAECAVASAGCLFGLVCDPDLDQPGVGRETLDAGDRLVRHLVSLRQADPPSAHAVPLADCWHRRPSVVLVVYRVVGVLVPSADSAGRGRFAQPCAPAGTKQFY